MLERPRRLNCDGSISPAVKCEQFCQACEWKSEKGFCPCISSMWNLTSFVTSTHLTRERPSWETRLAGSSCWWFVLPVETHIGLNVYCWRRYKEGDTNGRTGQGEKEDKERKRHRNLSVRSEKANHIKQFLVQFLSRYASSCFFSTRIVTSVHAATTKVPLGLKSHLFSQVFPVCNELEWAH